MEEAEHALAVAVQIDGLLLIVACRGWWSALIAGSSLSAGFFPHGPEQLCMGR